MSQKFPRFTPVLLILSALLSACNLPGKEAPPARQTVEILTAVAETVAAGQSGSAGGDGSVTVTATSENRGETATDSPQPSDIPPATILPTPSQTPLPCNLARFITDVTIPDGTVLAPGETFTKTWRLKNVGSCTWTSGYEIVFFGGDAMDAPSAVKITTGTVPPGSTVDVPVELIAPDEEGTYRGNWRLRDPADVIFGIENSTRNLFWVEIKVKELPLQKKLSRMLITAPAGIS